MVFSLSGYSTFFFRFFFVICKWGIFWDKKNDFQYGNIGTDPAFTGMMEYTWDTVCNLYHQHYTNQFWVPIWEWIKLYQKYHIWGGGTSINPSCFGVNISLFHGFCPTALLEFVDIYSLYLLWLISLTHSHLIYTYSLYRNMICPGHCHFYGYFRNLNWRYLPYIRPIC